ncbi:MAG: PilZ domain-containing protein [Archangium sp.]
MSALPAFHKLPQDRSTRLSVLSEVGVVELLTLTPRSAERLFDVSEGGAGVLSQDPLPCGTLVLAVFKLPRERKPFDVIVRIAWSEGSAMGLEFLLPDDALVEAIRRLRLELGELE